MTFPKSKPATNHFTMWDDQTDKCTEAAVDNTVKTSWLTYAIIQDLAKTVKNMCKDVAHV
jgi:hypothetical protein